MNFPHQLLDKILSYLSLDDEQDRRSLRNCSLVANPWTNSCRSRLFRTVEIHGEILQSWLDSISPANYDLLQHICSLSYVTAPSSWKMWEHRVDVLQDYLPSFHQLQHLTLSSMHIPSDISEQVDMFSAFRYTLSRLSLEYCHATASAIVTLLNYFPGLDRLDLIHLLHEVDDKPTPPFSRSPIRELHISEFFFAQDALNIFDQLSELGLAFDEIVVDGQSQAPLSALGRVAGALGVNAKRIELLQPLQPSDTDNGSTLLSRCRDLRELELAVTFLGSKGAGILSSITSTSIQKVSLVHRYSASWSGIVWTYFDKPLCQLADKLGCTHKLEVDVRIIVEGVAETGEDIGVVRIADYFSGFREKGQLRVVLVGPDGSGSVIYPPAPAR